MEQRKKRREIYSDYKLQRRKKREIQNEVQKSVGIGWNLKINGCTIQNFLLRIPFLPSARCQIQIPFVRKLLTLASVNFQNRNRCTPYFEPNHVCFCFHLSVLLAKPVKTLIIQTINIRILVPRRYPHQTTVVLLRWLYSF